MDTLTQQLRSQVCLDWNHSAILAGATANSVTFYADYSADGKKPVSARSPSTGQARDPLAAVPVVVDCDAAAVGLVLGDGQRPVRRRQER